MKLIMENWKSYLNEQAITEEVLELYHNEVLQQLLEEGFLQDIAAKYGNAMKGLALAAALTSPMAMNVSAAEAAPKTSVQKVIRLSSDMSDKEKAAVKKKIAETPDFLNIYLVSLNSHIDEPMSNRNLESSTRDMTLNVLGATREDFPVGQTVTAEELKTFLLTGEGPGLRDSDAESEEPTELCPPGSDCDAFLDDAEDAGRQMKGAAEKGIKFLKDLFETFEADSAEDKIESVMTDIDNALYYNDNTSDLPEKDLETIRKHVKMALHEIFER